MLDPCRPDLHMSDVDSGPLSGFEGCEQSSDCARPAKLRPWSTYFTIANAVNSNGAAIENITALKIAIVIHIEWGIVSSVCCFALEIAVTAITPSTPISRFPYCLADFGKRSTDQSVRASH